MTTIETFLAIAVAALAADAIGLRIALADARHHTERMAEVFKGISDESMCIAKEANDSHLRIVNRVVSISEDIARAVIDKERATREGAEAAKGRKT